MLYSEDFVYLQQQVIQLVKFFCTTNSNGDYCLELQDNFYNGILRPPTSDIEVSMDVAILYFCYIYVH